MKGRVAWQMSLDPRTGRNKAELKSPSVKNHELNNSRCFKQITVRVVSDTGAANHREAAGGDVFSNRSKVGLMDLCVHACMHGQVQGVLKYLNKTV